eukprot:m51a1_g12161 hypothetical protein (67) ;mRNA; r:10673-10927
MLDLRCDNLVILAIHPMQSMERHIFGVPFPSKTRECSTFSIIKIEDVATFLEDRTNFEGHFLFGVP